MSYRAFILTRGLLGLVFFYFFPIHDLLEGGAVVVLAHGSPLHLVAFQALDLPPLAQLVLALVLPTGSQQRAVNEVVLEKKSPKTWWFQNKALPLHHQNYVELKNNGMNNIPSKEDQLALIQSKIYEIRGVKVMLDFDLAEAYGVETSQLKRQVRRNIERFEGDDFMIELTRDELSRCQIGTLNIKRGQNVKYLPFAFTELGVAMLSSILRSPAAIKVNRDIMRAFVAIRQMVSVLPKPDVTADVVQLRKEFEELKLDIEDILHDQNDINESTRACGALFICPLRHTLTPFPPLCRNILPLSQQLRQESG